MSIELDHKTKIEPLAGFEDQVRQLFRNTLLMGQPLNIDIDEMDIYEELNIGWYLQFGLKSGAVLLEGTTVVGYVLMCVDHQHYTKWLQKISLRLIRRVLSRLCTFRLSRNSRRFYRWRLIDTYIVWRSRSTAHIMDQAHVHLNIAESHRASTSALLLMRHLDSICREQGVSEWTGEVNSIVGHRERALERFVGNVLEVKKNHTLTALTGKDINRITVRHVVPNALLC